VLPYKVMACATFDLVIDVSAADEVVYIITDNDPGRSRIRTTDKVMFWTRQSLT